MKGGRIKNDKSNISQSQSYQEIGEYWDKHDLCEVREKTEPAEFVLNGDAETPIDSALSEKLNAIAQQRGVSAQTLLNLWLQEKVTQEPAYTI